jgi:hypothetical protein
MSTTQLIAYHRPTSIVARVRAAAAWRPVLTVALITALLSFVVLTVLHRSPTPPALSAATALRDVRSDPASARTVARLRVTRAETSAIDRRFVSLSLYDERRLLLTAVVSTEGKVLYTLPAIGETSVDGGGLTSAPFVLALLGAAFVLVTGVWPLRRIRNLDVLVATATAAAILLFNAWMDVRMVLVAWPLMLYMAARCLMCASRPEAAPGESVPLYERLTSSWSEAQRLWMLRAVLAACAVMLLVAGISSRALMDVAYAVMEGATSIVHGVLPYAHIPDIPHGDTYPVGSYLAYVPLALLSPVRSEWNAADIVLYVSVGAAALGSLGVYRLVRGRLSGSARDGARRALGLRAAIAWLTFPPVLATVASGTTDIVLATVLVGALLLWRWPSIAATVLGAAAWFKLVPLALLPLWIAPMDRRRRVRALGGIVLVSLPALAAVIALGGLDGPGLMMQGIAYQSSRPPLNSLWAAIGSVPGQQLTQAATLALIAGAVVALRRDRALADDRRRFAALCAAVMLGLQMSSSYWSFMYLVWALPFLLLMMFSDASADPAVAQRRMS